MSILGTARTASDDIAALQRIGTSDPQRLSVEYIVEFPTSQSSFERGIACASVTSSIAGNVESGLELYRASKSAQNILSRGIFAEIGPKGQTILDIRPGWAATAMGTLNGTVAAEIDTETSVRGVADVVERHMGSGQHLYLDYQDQPLAW